MGKQKYRHHPELVRMYAQKEEMMPTIDQRTQIDDSSSYSKHPAAHVPGDNIKIDLPKQKHAPLTSNTREQRRRVVAIYHHPSCCVCVLYVLLFPYPRHHAISPYGVFRPDPFTLFF